MGTSRLKGERYVWLLFAGLVLLLAVGLAGLITRSESSRAKAANDPSESRAVLPCKRMLTLTAIYRVDGRIRFEGVADRSYHGKKVRIYEIRTDRLVVTTTVRRDGTWWATSPTNGHRYTWLSKFVAESGPAQTHWRRLGQAVSIRSRKPVRKSNRSMGSGSRTRVQVKISGGLPGVLVAGRQTGCLKHEVEDQVSLRTGPGGVATISLPRPAAGQPYAIYRVRTADGIRISPPIVVKPVG